VINLPDNHSGRYLSLRWKALIGLSVVLIAVNASLAFFSYTQLVDQFERQQTSVRDRQAKQLKALLDINRCRDWRTWYRCWFKHARKKPWRNTCGGL
jgi:hypothetical protein